MYRPMLKVAFKSHSRVIQVKLAIVAGVGLMTGLGDTPSSSHQLQAWYQLLVHDVMQSADGVGGGGRGGSTEDTRDNAQSLASLWVEDFTA